MSNLYSRQRRFVTTGADCMAHLDGRSRHSVQFTGRNFRQISAGGVRWPVPCLKEVAFGEFCHGM
jgi:hypothetical protein